MKAFKLENEPKIKSGFKTQIITLKFFKNLMNYLKRIKKMFSFSKKNKIVMLVALCVN
jgi:hypothetical protein